MNNTLNVIGTGLNGLVGSKVVSELADRCSFENIDIRHPISPVDITNEQQVMEFLIVQMPKLSFTALLLPMWLLPGTNGEKKMAWHTK